MNRRAPGLAHVEAAMTNEAKMFEVRALEARRSREDHIVSRSNGGRS
jgi:hypothetical protein